jgi:hypothetical protein
MFGLFDSMGLNFLSPSNKSEKDGYCNYDQDEVYTPGYILGNVNEDRHSIAVCGRFPTRDLDNFLNQTTIIILANCLQPCGQEVASKPHELVSVKF